MPAVHKGYNKMVEREGGRYGSVAKSLHWLILALLIAQFTFAWTMPHIGRTVPSSILIDCHVWFGVTILFVAMIRLFWRLTHGEPEPEDGIPPWQVATARLIHWLLYALLFTIPILGWVNASWRGMHVTLFGLVELPKLLATRVPGWRWTGDIHSLLANYGLLALVCVHVAAALYHYLIRRDGVLHRMLPA
jgi:cytochrome b561